MSTTAIAALPAIASVDPQERRRILRDLLIGCRARVQPQEAGLSPRRTRRSRQSRRDAAQGPQGSDEKKPSPGLSQEQTAFLLGISVKSYRALENGTVAHPSVVNLMRLIEIFHMDSSESTLLLHTAYRIPDFCDHDHQDHGGQIGTSRALEAAELLSA